MVFVKYFTAVTVSVFFFLFSVLLPNILSWVGRLFTRALGSVHHVISAFSVTSVHKTGEKNELYKLKTFHTKNVFSPAKMSDKEKNKRYNKSLNFVTPLIFRLQLLRKCLKYLPPFCIVQPLLGCIPWL